MNVAVLGANWPLCAGAINQAVVPATGLPSPSVQVKAAPPHSWTSIPRCRLYQACSAGASLALKKMPPMPVTRFMKPPRMGGGEEECVYCGLTFALTGDGAFLWRARRRQVQRVVRQLALALGGPPWPSETPAAQRVLHRRV